MQSVVMLSIVMLSDILLSVVMLIVVMLIVVMLSVVAPVQYLSKYAQLLFVLFSFLIGCNCQK